MYARGTVRSGSKHYPKHTTLDKDSSSRGDFQQSVAEDHGILAASWCDGNIVTMVTSADGSTPTTVTRRIRDESRGFPAPTCILQYNQHMQGVDRLDQLRARFSLADRHSYKKWHKKLALSLIDIARVNAYSSRKLAIGTSNDRDSHRIFLIELISELISGRWKNAPSNNRTVYKRHNLPEVAGESPSTTPRRETPLLNVGKLHSQCESVSSKQLFRDAGRKKRQCVVCRYEERYLLR